MTVTFSEREKAFLIEHSICRFATADSQGQPHIVPLGYAFDGNMFWMTTGPNSKKHRNLKDNPRVSLVVDEPKKPRKAVVVLGEASVYENGSDFERGIEMISRLRGWRRWKPGEQIVILVAPTKKTSWGIEEN
jgi:nitroimidazol reductase NimA-like FMN-containing flavoprotein (pyridoxamine 5'-phosphate oxidase superfamily)